MTKSWDAEHKDWKREYDRKYRAANKDRILARKRKFRLLHPDKEREAKQRYFDRHPDKKTAKNRNHRVHRRAAFHEVEVALNHADWLEIQASYLSKCVYCGKPAESQDHVTALSRGGSHTADNVVPACRSCNSRKGTKSLLMFLYRQNVTV